MRIGVATWELSLPGTGSLKHKRSRLRPVLDGLRNRFKVSAAEVDWQDIHDRALIAAAVVGAETGVVEGVLAKLGRAVEEYDVRVDDFRTEVI